MPRANRTRHNPVPSAAQITADVVSQMEALPAAYIPPYAVADLPAASDNQNCIVMVSDDPQGLATSVPSQSGWYWRTEVDGSSLGPGNARSGS